MQSKDFHVLCCAFFFFPRKFKLQMAVHVYASAARPLKISFSIDQALSTKQVNFVSSKFQLQTGFRKCAPLLHLCHLRHLRNPASMSSPSPPPTSSSSSGAPSATRRPQLCPPATPRGLLASPPSKFRKVNSCPVTTDKTESNSSNPQNPQLPLLRMYPFPPPTIPLTTPLNDSTSESLDNCLRKRFLRRWRTHAPAAAILTPCASNAPARRQKHHHSLQPSSQNPATLERPTHNLHQRAHSPSAQRFSHKARMRSPFDLVEGDPVLPPHSPGSSSPSYSVFGHQIRKPRQSQTCAKHRIELQNRIRYLRRRRRVLENSRTAEIASVAAALRSQVVSHDDRVQLKTDLERLSPQGVRASVGLISRSFVAGLPHGKEVKLRLDLLPADVIRELQLVVMQENNQLSTATTSQLHKVCMELSEAVKEVDEKKCV